MLLIILHLIHTSSSIEFIQLEQLTQIKLKKSVFNNCTYNKKGKDCDTLYMLLLCILLCQSPPSA